MNNKILTMLGALMALATLVGCSYGTTDPVKEQEEIAEYRIQELDLVRSTVLDEDRAERLVELLADRDRMMADYTKVIETHRQEMTALNADYNAQRESFDLLVSGYNDQRATAQEGFISLLKAMKQETTAEEWQIISKYSLKRLEPRGLIYNQPSGGA
jgi:hypothetical protein